MENNDIIISGEIIQISPIKQGNNWQAQTIIIKEINKQYPKHIAFDLINKEVEKYSTLRVGDYISAHVNIESREYLGRYYTNIKAWRIDVIETTTTAEPELQPEDERMPF